MATGTEMYAALREATREIEVTGEFTINAVEAHDRRKLSSDDLVTLGFDQKIAKEVSSSLLKNDYAPLAKAMGLQLSISHNAPKLLGDSTG